MFELKKILSFLKIFDRDLKKRLFFFFFIVITFGIFELFGIGSLIVFFDILMSENIENLNFLSKNVTNFLGINDYNSLVYIAGFITVISITVRNLFLILEHYYKTKFVYYLQTILIKRVYNNYLNQDYNFFLKHTSNQLSKNIIQEVPSFTGRTIMAFLSIISNMIIILILTVIIFILETKAIIASISFIAIYYTIVFRNLKKKVNEIGNKRFNSTEQIFETVRDSIEGFKEIKIYNFLVHLNKKMSTFLQTYMNVYIKFSLYRILPRQILEICLIMFTVTFILLIFEDGFVHIISSLILLVTTLYRVLPRVDGCLQDLVLLNFDLKTYNTITDHLQLKTKTNKTKINKINSMELRGIEFKYPSQSKLIKSINLNIKTGDFIGIYGKNGSGKTTLIELMCRFLKPNKGEIFINNKIQNQSIFSRLSYIPQKSFFFNGTIRENITFFDESDQKKSNDFYKALDLSGVSDFINQKEDKENFTLKDNAKNLSGGQRQKVALARAIYKNSDVIVLDEATNAFDNNSEKKIFEKLKYLSENKIIIIITHNSKILKYCNKKFKIENGSLRKI